ncbi:MAG: ATP-binding cassette domain-containing protein [Verrucomicrobiota bacterium]
MNPVIEVKHLALSPRAEKAGRFIGFEVYPGEIVTITGENGSGKSLLLSSLAGQRISPSATVRVRGLDLFHPRERARAQSLLGVMFQNTGLLRALNVFDNVALPFLVDSLDVSRHLQEQVHLRLSLVGCQHLSDESPETLAAGDRRCVALARALSGKARIFLGDEPLTGLSSAKKAMIEDLMVTLVGCGALDAAVFFTQDLEFASRVSTRFIFLRAPERRRQILGGIECERTRETLFDEPLLPGLATLAASRRRESTL